MLAHQHGIHVSFDLANQGRGLTLNHQSFRSNLFLRIQTQGKLLKLRIQKLHHVVEALLPLKKSVVSKALGGIKQAHTHTQKGALIYGLKTKLPRSRVFNA